MDWYLKRYEELKKAEPIISVCGDDCAVCPRYLAQTDEELHETALFWYKAGWRDYILSNEEIKCTGCGFRPQCSFMLLPCTVEHGVNMCYECSSFVCDKVRNTIAISEEKMKACREACDSDAEFEMMRRAFYNKEKNMRVTGEESD